MKVTHFHGEETTQLFSQQNLHLQPNLHLQFLSLLSVTSYRNLHELKQLTQSLDNDELRKPTKTQHLSKLTFNYIVEYGHSTFSTVKDKAIDAKQSFYEFKNRINLSEKIKNFQTNYAHEKNHEIHEEVKVILYGMIGCCLYYSVLGRNETALSRVAAGLAAMFFSGMVVRQNDAKKQK